MGAMEGSVRRWSESTASLMGVSASELRDNVRSVAELARNMGMAAEPAALLGEQVAALAVDLSSFASVPVDRAMTVLRNALMGNARAMNELGISVKENALDQYLLAHNVGKTSDELTDAERVTYRFKLIMEQTSAAQGDSVRRQDSLANTTRRLNAEISDLQENIGQHMLPVELKMLQVKATLIGLLAKASEHTGVLTGGMIALAGAIGTVGVPLGEFMMGLSGLMVALPKIEKMVVSLYVALAAHPFVALGIVVTTVGALMINSLTSQREEVEELADAYEKAKDAVRGLSAEERARVLRVYDIRIGRYEAELQTIAEKLDVTPDNSVLLRWYEAAIPFPELDVTPDNSVLQQRRDFLMAEIERLKRERAGAEVQSRIAANEEARRDAIARFNERGRAAVRTRTQGLTTEEAEREAIAIADAQRAAEINRRRMERWEYVQQGLELENLEPIRPAPVSIKMSTKGWEFERYPMKGVLSGGGNIEREMTETQMRMENLGAVIRSRWSDDMASAASDLPNHFKNPIETVGDMFRRMFDSVTVAFTNILAQRVAEALYANVSSTSVFNAVANAVIGQMNNSKDMSRAFAIASSGEKD